MLIYCCPDHDFNLLWRKQKASKGSGCKGHSNSVLALQGLGCRGLKREQWEAGEGARLWHQTGLGFSLCSTIFWLCDLKQVAPPLWASISYLQKWKFMTLPTRHIGRTPKDTGCKVPSNVGYHYCHYYWNTFLKQSPTEPTAWLPVTEIANA